jgi:hypothetical protein
MTHRPLFWQQNANERSEFEQTPSKRQQLAYENWDVSVGAAAHSHSARYFTSSDRVSTSALQPENYYSPHPEQIEHKDAFLVQNHLIDGSLGAIRHISNQYTSLQQPTSNIHVSTSTLTHWFPTHSFPAPSFPAPSYPAPSYPAPSYPAPSYPAPSYPAPSYPAPFISVIDQAMMWNSEHADLPLRQGLPAVPMNSTTDDQVCFGMASYH